MSELNTIKPFRQVPSCDPDTLLTITGEEYASIQNLLNVFEGPLNAIRSVFTRNLNEGKIVIKYVQEDGTEIPEKEAIAYLDKMKDYLKSQDEAPKTVSKSKLKKV